MAPTLFCGTVCCFDVVIDDSETTALVLKCIGDRVELALNDLHFRIDLFYFGIDFLARGFRFGVKLLVLGVLFDFFFALSSL